MKLLPTSEANFITHPHVYTQTHAISVENYQLQCISITAVSMNWIMQNINKH